METAITARRALNEERHLLGVTLCSQLKVERRCLENIALIFTVSRFHVGFLIGLFFDPEYGDDMSLRNIE
jgi:hypothetical protein